MNHDAALIPGLIGGRARNLYETRQLHCSEAVLAVLSASLGGAISEDLAIRLASALPDGLGGSGCVCGALNGGMLALGLFLGRDRPGGRDRHGSFQAARVLRRRFEDRFRSPCCGVLHQGGDSSHCGEITGFAAGTAAHLILKLRPELIENVDWNYLSRRDTRLGSGFKRAANRIRSV